MASNGDDLGTLLGVWAHPDDETYSSAGLMARAVEQGRRVVCVTATKGEAGFPDGDTRSLDDRKALREQELTASLTALGIRDHRWLDYPDGGCAAVPDDEAVARIIAVIDEVRPDTLLTFGPDGGTGHGDHVSACRWSTLAVQQLGTQAPTLLYAARERAAAERLAEQGFDPTSIMMIPDFQPETTAADDLAVWLTCDDALLDRKIRALRAQVSQIDPVIALFGLDRFMEFNRDEYFRLPHPGDADTLAQATAYSRRALSTEEGSPPID